MVGKVGGWGLVGGVGWWVGWGGGWGGVGGVGGVVFRLLHLCLPFYVSRVCCLGHGTFHLPLVFHLRHDVAPFALSVIWYVCHLTFYVFLFGLLCRILQGKKDVTWRCSLYVL